MSQLIVTPSDITRDFTKIPNSLIKRPDLSATAKVILMYLMGRPDNWKVYLKELVRHFKESEYIIRKALAELQALGLLQIDITRDQASKITGRVWKVLAHLLPSAAKPCAGSSHTEDPQRGEPQATKTDLSQTEFSKTQSGQPGDDPDQAQKDEFKNDEPEEKPAGPLRDILNRCKQMAKAPLPEWRQKMDAAQREFEKRQALMHQKTALAAPAGSQIEKYQHLSPENAVEALCGDFLSNPEPYRDQKNKDTLAAWYAGPGQSRLADMVTAFEQAGARGAISVKYVLKVLGAMA